MNKALAFVLVAFAPSSVVFAAATGLASPATPVEMERNKAVARRVFDEIFNQGRFQVAQEIYASDFVNHGLHRDADLEEDQEAARWEKTVLPDLKMKVESMVAEGDLVTVLWTARGTNTVGGGGWPATGMKVEERGITIWRIVDGKIREEWSEFDLTRVVRQFVAQFKWLLMGLFCAGLILLWAVSRLTRRLWRALGTHAPKTA